MVAPVEQDERARAASLLDAQTKAIDFFHTISDTLVRSGVTEKALSDEIHALGQKQFNVRTHWHKRVVRSGPNTLLPYAENPPDREIEADDILFVDLGPVFEAWEADFGRTFVMGNDPHKQKLQAALEPLWHAVKARYYENPSMTGGKLYDIACEMAAEAGWEFGGPIAGHIVGDFPHERIPRDKITLYIAPGNELSMSECDAKGNKRHWILEIHLVDRAREIGGFFEQLLTVESD